jgi:hypothetical protein
VQNAFSRKLLRSLIPIVGGIILACFLFYGWQLYSTWNPYQTAQQKLAQQLGVRIEDYPYPIGFPSGYYYAVLKPSMGTAEVHTIIREYAAVYHCKQYSEIYYYYSQDEDRALRFEIFYDENGISGNLKEKI